MTTCGQCGTRYEADRPTCGVPDCQVEHQSPCPTCLPRVTHVANLDGVTYIPSDRMPLGERFHVDARTVIVSRAEYDRLVSVYDGWPP